MRDAAPTPRTPHAVPADDRPHGTGCPDGAPACAPGAEPRRAEPAGGRTRFVSRRGSDRSGTGERRRPFRTLTKAAAVAEPGDTVLVRGGVYGRATIRTTGTRSRPIAFRPYRREKVVFDGRRARVPTRGSLVTIARSAHVTFEGFVIRHSRGRGLSATDGRHLTIRDNVVHDTEAHPVLGSGHHLRFVGNHIYRGILSNRMGRAELGYWPAGLSTWVTSDGARSSDVVFRGNLIHDTWGEGIIALHANDVVVAQNTVHDVWSVAVYVTDAARVRIDANHLYRTSRRFDRRGRPATGVMLANEHLPDHDVPERPLADITISNNIVTNTYSGVHYWHDPSRTRANTYRRVRVLHNVLMDSASAALRIDAVPGAHRRPAANLAANNVIYRGYEGATLTVGNPRAWRLSHNAFPDGVPRDGGTAGIADDPAFTNPAGGDPTGFRLEPGSPLIGAGTPVRGVPRDMWGTPRPVPPTIGVYEARR